MRKQLLMTLLVVALLPLSASAQEGKAVLKNVASGLYWAAGNNWGTRASLMPASEYQILHKQPDGTYQMEAQVSNGGTSYFFNGDYMDQTPPMNLTLTKTGDYYTVAAPSGALFGNSTEAGANPQSSFILGKVASGDDALWEIIFEKDWDSWFKTASEDNPLDLTFLINNPSYGRNNRNLGTVWTVTAGNPNLSGGTNENRVAESYMAAFDVYQTVANLPNGLYEVSAQAAVTYHDNRTIKEFDGVNAPVIYANDETSDFVIMTDGDKLTSMNQLSNAFSAGNYEVASLRVSVTGGKLTIGAKSVRSDIWCVWDNFRLIYLGFDWDSFIAGYLKIVEEANVAVASSETMSEKVRGELNDAINKYGNLDTSLRTEEAKKAMEEASKALREAIDAVEESINSYKALEAGELPKESSSDQPQYTVPVGWTVTNNGNFRINGWSVEGDSDGSGMTTPFIENWINGWSGDVLSDGKVYYTFKGLEPGLKVKVSALARAYSEIGNEIAGAYYFVGDQRINMASEGVTASNGDAKLAYGTFSSIGTVDEKGELCFGLETADASFNFFAIKDIKVEIVPPSPDVTITSFVAPGRVLINEETKDFDVNLSITNLGDLDAENALVKLYDDEGLVAIYPRQKYDVSPLTGVSLPVGENLDITLTYGKELVHGNTLHIYATVECDGEDGNYTDNNRTDYISVKLVMDGSDMTVTGATVDNVIRMTDEDTSVDVPITVKVKNQGTQPADGVVVELKDAEGNVVAQSDPISVGAGEEQEVVVTYVATESGSYSFEVSVTSDADIDEENNVYGNVEFKVKKTGELVDGVDGEIVEVEIEGMDTEGNAPVDNEKGGITVNVTVANNGKENAKNVVVKLFVNGEEYATNADVEGFETLDLEAAGEVIIPFLVEISEFTEYEIYAEVIVEGDVDESNNVSAPITFTAFYEGIDVAYLFMTYPSVIDMDSEEDAIVAVMVKNVSEDSRVTDDLKLKAENVVVHLYIDGVECATSKPFSLYKGSDAHAYLAIDRSFLTSDLVILTAQVTADKDGNPTNDWSEEVEIAVVGVVTGIDSILAKYGADATIYTIDGKKVDLNSGMLKKGLYIINGKKAAIK